MNRPTKKTADPAPKTAVFQARVSETLRNELWAMCEELGIEESEAIRRAIREWLDLHSTEKRGSSRTRRLSSPSPDLVMLNAPKKGKIKD